MTEKKYKKPSRNRCRDFARNVQTRVNKILKGIHPQLSVEVKEPKGALPDGPAAFVSFPVVFKFKSSDGRLAFEHKLQVMPVNSEIQGDGWWACHMLGLTEKCCQIWGTFYRDEVRSSKRAINQLASDHLASLT
jgi:hypothetical protein